MKMTETMADDTMLRHININMTLDEKLAINTVNRLISHIISVVGYETFMCAENDGIIVDTNQLARAKEALKAIVNNREWDEI